MESKMGPGRVAERTDWRGFEITVPMQEAAWENRTNPSGLWASARASGYVREALKRRVARLATGRLE